MPFWETQQIEIKMPYSVVETKGRSKLNQLTAVPDGWINIQENLIYWPKNGFTILLEDEHSTYELNWQPEVIIKIWHRQLDHKHAEKMVEHHLDNSDFSDVPPTDEDEIAICKERQKKRISQPNMLPRSQ